MNARTLLGVCSARYMAFAVVMALSWPQAVGQTPPLPPPLRAALEQSGVSNDGVGLYVREIDSAVPLLEHHADRPMNPASAMKLVTTLAGLELLGPGFTWRTEAWLDGTVNDEVLEGNLVLKGYGDPKLTYEDFWLFLRQLRARGLRDIRGDLILDRTVFAPQDFDPGRFDNDPSRPYNVGADALLVNYKAFRLQFIPDESQGSVRIIATPPLPQVSIVNQLTLGVGPCYGWPDTPAVDYLFMELVFAGVYPIACGERQRSFSLLDRDQYLYGLFASVWRELGGTLLGGVRGGALPERAEWFATWESPALTEVTRDINKFSNNVMARQLFLTLSLAATNPPATTQGAVSAVQAWLSRAGLNFPELYLENGSGLSRSERISARHLGELLAYAWHSPFMPEFVSSLPIPGIDGTLRRRLTGSATAGRAHLKTGYLAGVRAVAGYIDDSAGKTLVVVALINDPNAAQAQVVQDALIEWAYWYNAGMRE